MPAPRPGVDVASQPLRASAHGSAGPSGGIVLLRVHFGRRARSTARVRGPLFPGGAGRRMMAPRPTSADVPDVPAAAVGRRLPATREWSSRGFAPAATAHTRDCIPWCRARRLGNTDPRPRPRHLPSCAGVSLDREHDLDDDRTAASGRHGVACRPADCGRVADEASAAVHRAPGGVDALKIGCPAHARMRSLILMLAPGACVGLMPARKRATLLEQHSRHHPGVRNAASSPSIADLTPTCGRNAPAAKRRSWCRVQIDHRPYAIVGGCAPRT
jgi:hypothetical protein